MIVPTYAEYYGAVFPEEEDVRLDIEYGPDGDGMIGTLQVSDPPSSPDACQVTASVLDVNGDPVPNAIILVQLEKGATSEDNLIGQMRRTFATNSSGIATFELLKRSQFTSGGIYRIQCFDATGSILIYSRRVYSANTTFANLEDLEIIP